MSHSQPRKLAVNEIRSIRLAGKPSPERLVPSVPMILAGLALIALAIYGITVVAIALTQFA